MSVFNSSALLSDFMIWKNLIIFLSCRFWWRSLKCDHRVFYFLRLAEETNFLLKILFEFCLLFLQNVVQINRERNDFSRNSNQLIRNFASRLFVLTLNIWITIMILKKIFVIDNCQSDCKEQNRFFIIDMNRLKKKTLLKSHQKIDLLMYEKSCFDIICVCFDEQFISWRMWNLWYLCNEINDLTKN
jgi:hypothetical protein